MHHPAVSLRDIWQSYGKKPVLSGISLELDGGVLGLLGPNGAGKTTLLRTLATLIPATRGDVSIHGQQITTGRQARQARRGIGYLPQDFGYLPSFSVCDFVRYAAWLREVPDRDAHAHAVRAIESVGLTDRSGDRLKTLSGGMLRRAGIASAIVGEPGLVLLDEPTVGLDPAQRLDFRALIRGLDSAVTVLSTHLVEDVVALCDRVVVLEQGRVVFTGTAEQLSGMARPGSAGDSDIERGYMSVLQSLGRQP